MLSSYALLLRFCSALAVGGGVQLLLLPSSLCHSSASAYFWCWGDGLEDGRLMIAEGWWEGWWCVAGGLAMGWWVVVSWRWDGGCWESTRPEIDEAILGPNFSSFLQST